MRPAFVLIALGLALRLLSDTPSYRHMGSLLALTGLGCAALALVVFAFLHWRRQL